MSAGPLAAVTGATGVVGPTLVRRLVGEGYRVRILSRRPPSPGLLPVEVEVVLGDLSRFPDLRAFTAGAQVVFHLAAHLHQRDVDDAALDAYERVNVEGTRALIDAARAEGVRRFVFFSTINVYGPTEPGRVHSEDSPPRPETPYARSKLEGERAVLAAAASDFEPVVLRLAAVYGRRMKGNYPLLLRAIRSGWFVPVGRGENRRTLVHVEDVARAALLAAEHPAAAGRVYNVTDGQVHTFRSIVEAMASAVGRRPPRFHLPAGPIRAALRIGGAVPGLSRHAGRAGALLEKLLEDVAVSGDRLARELGFRPRYGLREGWLEAAGSLEVDT